MWSYLEKIALVTGASAEMGLSMAVKLATPEVKVYAVMRNLDNRTALEQAANSAGVDLETRQLEIMQKFI